MMLVALGFSLGQYALAGVATNYYRGEMNSWGTTGMQNVGGYWRTTILSDGDDSSSEFKFDASGAWTAGQQWARGATVSLATKDTAYANPGGNANFNETNAKYYTFTIKDENTGTDADHCIQETANEPVTFSRSGEDSGGKHGIDAPNTITVTTSGSDPDEDIYIRYSTDGGSTWSEVKTAGSGTTFTNDIPGQSQGTTVQYYTFSSTFAAVDTDTDLKTIRYDDSGYGNNTSYTIPTLGNCWHYPKNSEPSGTTMRSPLGTPASTGDLYIYSGSQFQGGNDADQTGGAVYHRKVGAAGWSSASLTYDTINGNNKYWYGTIVSGTYSAGDDIEYYLKAEYSNRDTTYIGSTDGYDNSTTYEFEAPAQANTFKAYYAPDTSGAIWSEDFQGYAVGSGIDHNGNAGDYPGSVTKWTLDVSGGSLTTAGDYLETTDEAGDLRMEAQDVDGAVTWTSENIDISLYTDVEFTLSAFKNDALESTDYLNVEYQTDGGGWTLIQDWNGEGSATRTWEGDGASSSASMTQAVSGASLDIRVTMNNNVGGELISFDNVIVSGTLAAPSTPTGIKVTDTNSIDFTVEWDEMASATNYAIDVSTESTFQTATGNGVHINEVHADSNGEFIELVAPAGTDLTGYKLVHHNGAGSGDGAEFTHTIGSFTVPDDGITDENGAALGFYVVKNSADTVTNFDDDWGSTSLQNGDDGIVLYNASDAILDAALWGPPPLDEDLTVDDPGTVTTSGVATAANYMHYIGNDTSANSAQAPNAVRADDGTGWVLAAATPGAINSGQTSGSIVLQAATPSYAVGYSNTLTGTDEAITVSGLTHSTTYYYRLRSMGTGGTSANSATQSVTTEAPASGGANATLSRTGGETANIDYASYQSANITGSGNAVSVMDLQIADGVSDAYTTEMTNLSIAVAGHANLRKAALYDGATEIAEVAVTGSPITFSGMSGANVTAADTGTKDLTLYVTFQSSVTDNEQLSFTVSSVSATVGGTTFAAADGGGAASLTSGDNNRIEVAATKLVLSGTPATVGISEDFSATVTAKDALDNADLDSTTSVTITQSGNNGTLTGGGATALTAGTHTFSTLQVDGSGSFTITASDGSLTDDTSGTITISELNVGDIYFTGFNANGDEDLAFVAFEDVPANTVLYFSTDEWNGSAFANGGPSTVEQFSWNSGGSVLNAGTVVVLSSLDTTGGRSASVGTLAGDATSINLNNDGVFCYYGSDADTPTRFLAAVGNGTEAAAFGTFTGTGLTDGETGMTLNGGTEIGAYTNARAGFAKSTYKTMVADESNWAKEDPYNHGTPPDAPLDDTAFTFASLPPLSEGDLAFVAFNADGNDGFAVVALAEIPANANIYFTDNGWTNSPAGLLDSEGALTWATGGSAIPAGTVIRFELGGMTADNGTVSETDAGFDIGAGNDGIFAFIGTADDDPTTFLAAVGNGTSAQNCFGTLDGTGLTLGDTALIFGSGWDVAEYVATRSGEDAFADYRTLITNTGNWVSQDDSGDQGADGTRPDVPFNSSPFLLGPAPSAFLFR